MNLKASKKGLKKAVFAVFLAITLVPLPLQVVHTKPPQHVRYEMASELSLPPWRKLIISWVIGNISNNWGYIKLLPFSPITEDLPLFLISGPKRQILWRLESFDVFDGKGWGQSALSLINVALNETLGRVYNTSFIVQINETISRHYVGVIPLPTSNESVSGITLEVEGDLLGYLTSYGSLVISGNISEPSLAYRVAYSPPSYNLTELAKAKRDDIPQEILRRYTALPADTPPELNHLIESLRDDDLTIMEQLNLILHYFSQFKFNPNLSAENITENPVAWFLKNKEGDSSLFATAFVLVARGTGIPSRFVVGFKPRRVSTGSFWVRSSDIYSWAEVYLPEAGWIPLDPIPDPIRTEDALTSEVLSNLTFPFIEREKEKPESNQSIAITPNETISEKSAVVKGNESLPEFLNETKTSSRIGALLANELFLLLLIGSAASIAISIGRLRRRRGETLEEEVVEETLKEEESLKMLEEMENIYQKVLDFYNSAQYREGIIFLGEKFQELTASLMDLSRQEWETYREFLKRFIENNDLRKDEEEALMSFLEILERAKYSQMPISQEDFLKSVKLFSALLELICSSLEASKEVA